MKLQCILTSDKKWLKNNFLYIFIINCAFSKIEGLVLLHSLFKLDNLVCLKINLQKFYRFFFIFTIIHFWWIFFRLYESMEICVMPKNNLKNKKILIFIIFQASSFNPVVSILLTSKLPKNCFYHMNKNKFSWNSIFTLSSFII